MSLSAQRTQSLMPFVSVSISTYVLPLMVIVLSAIMLLPLLSVAAGVLGLTLFLFLYYKGTKMY